MSANQIRVRRKETIKPKRKWMNVALAASIILLGAAAAFAVIKFSNNLVFFSPPLEITAEANRKIIRVPAGGDLQAAIEKANGGDVIELEAGATYYGKINLPVKQISDFITIQTSAARKLPADRRVSPAQSNLMAKIVTRGKGEPAVSAELGAHHYRFVGIEFASVSDDYIYNLILFGAGIKNLSEVPHDLEIDRCYIRSLKTGVTRRGVAANSANTTIKNSYFEGFAYPQEETQAISAWTGTKNLKIINNYVEAGAENILIGGSDPASADLIPSDVEIRGNLLVKLAEWRGKATLKTLFEIKNGKRVRFIGNFLENNYVGSAFRVTVRNEEGGAPFSTIEDALISDNIIKGAGDGVNILGRDDMQKSGVLNGLKIVNNLWLDLDAGRFEGDGYFVQIRDGRNIEIAHNTVFQNGLIIKAYGTPTSNFVFRDNIVAYNKYGVAAFDFLDGSAATKQYFSQILKNNLIVNNQTIAPGNFYIPAGNFKLNDYAEVGFADFSGKNFRLAVGSRFKGKATNKADIGCDIESLLSKMPKEFYERILK